MYFSTNLCRISFSICLSFILNINVEFKGNKITQIEEILGIKGNNINNNYTNNNYTNTTGSEIMNPTELYFKIFKYSPIILGVLVLILILKIPQRIAKLCGKSIFQIESDESMNEIKEGHDYYMEINQKYKGELIPKEKLSLPKDKYSD